MEKYKYLDIPEEDQKEIERALETLAKKLMPHLTVLTNEQRRFMPKVGINNQGFVRNATEYAESNPELFPSFMELKDIKRNHERFKLFQSFFFTIETVRNGLKDSIMDAGNKLIKDSHFIYDNVKISAKAKIYGARSAYKELKDSYPGRGPSKANQEDTQ